MALPEIKASGWLPPDSIKIVLSIRALISVANYSYVSGTAERRRWGRKNGDATWHGRGASSWAQRRKIQDRQENLILGSRVSYHHSRTGLRPVNEQATGPASLPGSLLRHSVLPALSFAISVCPSVSHSLPVTSFFCLSFSFFHNLALRERKREREREKKKTLLIYDKIEDLDPVIQFPHRDLRNSSTRREIKKKRGKKENLAMGKYAMLHIVS